MHRGNRQSGPHQPPFISSLGRQLMMRVEELINTAADQSDFCISICMTQEI
jgi:hypothetical protein